MACNIQCVDASDNMHTYANLLSVNSYLYVGSFKLVGNFLKIFHSYCKLLAG